MNRATLAATITQRPPADRPGSSLLPHEVDWLELRADLAGDLPASWLRQLGSVKLMYALRSRAAGGLFDGAAESRERRLIKAAESFDLVELEAPRDLTPAILSHVPPTKRLIASHAPAPDQHVLRRKFDKLSTVPARYYRLTSPAEHIGQAVAPLVFLKSLGRADVTAYATGAAGSWTSVISPALGWPIVFGTLADRADVHEGLSLNCLMSDYGLPRLRKVRQLYGILGNPVAHSLSPRIHNAAYVACGQQAIFVPLQVDDFDQFWQSLITQAPLAEIDLAVQGFTVASPHKETVSNTACDKSEIVTAARSSNLMYQRDGSWRTDTTDPDGVVLNLHKHSISLADRHVAVVGCGGSGRAIGAALKRAGARVTMFNRNLQRGQRARQLLEVPFVALSEFRAAAFSVVINATPVGRDGRSCPFEPAGLRDDAVVIDLVYGAEVTPLVEFARSRGLTTIDGRDVLCTQVARQFQLMTGQPMPPGLAERLAQRSCGADTDILSSRSSHVSTSVQDLPCLPES